MKSLKGILAIGEENIFKELSEIIAISQQTVILVKDMVKASYDEKVLSKNMQSVRELEKRSDELAFNIREDVTSGAISPNILDNLLECINTADDIIDLCYYISREFNRMAKTHSIDLNTYQEAELEGVYERLYNLAETSLQKLKTMLSTSDESEIARLRKEIEDIEEQGDEVKDKGFDKLYSIAPKLTYLQFFHYSEVLHKSDDILDSCEDVSQLIIAVVTSILK